MKWLLLVCCAVVTACPPGEKSDAKPTGTPTDPVQVCERVADVCRIDGSRLGVCTQKPDDACAGPPPCFVCMSQH